jgi:hypothetical protein
MNATDYREKAGQAFAEAEASFQRCDTDGFASQAASQLMGRQHQLDADIAENGGVWEFDALFDLDGNMVAAKKVSTRYGPAWGILADDDPHGQFVAWFRESEAQDEARARKANARKGYYVGRVRAAAKARMGGGGKGMGGMATCYPYVARVDGGFSRDAEVVDNGQ